MKKLIVAAAMLLGLAGVSFAQTTPAKTTPAKTASKVVQKKDPAPPATNAVVLKKDGTPDKRFKANKTNEKPATPVKKDGTPDMRYKQNKKKS
jgi:hypothetical protein